MKRILAAGLLLTSVCLIFFSLNCSRDSHRFSEFSAAENELQKIRTTRTETDRNLLERINFNGYPLFFDEPDSRWFYSIDYNNPVTDPVVDYIAAEKNVKIVFSGEITPGSYIPLIAYTGAEFREYTLTITTLPLIQIQSPDDYLTGIVLEDVHPIKFTLFDNRSDSRYPYVHSDGSIHIRGEISRFFEKKNFRITLTEKGTGKEILENQVPLLGLRPDGDWVLYSAYNDQEKIRNVFTSNLWMYSCADDNSFGLKNGMEYRYVELFWN